MGCRMINRDAKQYNRIMFIICLLVAVISISIPLYFSGGATKGYNAVIMDEGWSTFARGKTLENVTLSKQHFDSFDKGETLVIKTTMPYDMIQNPTLEIYSVHCALDITLDGVPIFNYGQAYLRDHKMLGYGWILVELPVDYEGKEITINFMSTEDNAFEGIPAITLIDGLYAIKNILNQGKIYLAIGLFLIIMGVLGMVVSIVYSFRRKMAIKMFCIMLFAFQMGIYTLCNADLMTLFNMDVATKSLLEYTSFYLFPIPFTIYFADWITEKGFPKKINILYNVWVALEIIMVMVIFTLHFSGVVLLPGFVTIAHMGMAVTIMIIAAVIIIKIRITGDIDKGLIAGFSIALFCAVGELVRYNIGKFGIGFIGNKYKSTIGIASLVVVITLFADLMSKMTTTLYREAQTKAFEKMAYTDELTGILNRRGIEEPLADLKNARAPYALMSIDMNLLKMMNDNYGHATGDRALTLIAKKLKEAFPEPNYVARVGGDEFTVIAPNTSRDWVEKHVKIFLNKLEEHNAKGSNITLSVAYGVAYSTEDDSPEKVFVIADKRMYEMKKESKMGRQV